MRGIYCGNDRKWQPAARYVAPDAADTLIVAHAPPCRRGRSGSGHGWKTRKCWTSTHQGVPGVPVAPRQADFVYRVTNSAHRSMRTRRFSNRSDRA